MTSTAASKSANVSRAIEFDSSVASNEEFSTLLEKTYSKFETNSLIYGKISDISKGFVVIDIGYKSQGQIAYSEFVAPDGSFSYKVDDKVEVYLEYLENHEGQLILSKEKANRIHIWDTIKELYDNEENIIGKIVGKVKAGLSVDIGIRAFLPGSQVDLKPVKDLDSLVGEKFEFRILKYDPKRNNVVLSRRAIMEGERKDLRRKTIEKLKPGIIIKGHVKNITDYGLFVDLGGIDGLMHVTDITWGRISHPSELYQIGDEIEAVVLSFDTENQRVSLGLKQKEQDPWESLQQRYKNQDLVRGKVVNLTSYGAFIEIEQGVEGLIHVSEMSWTKKIRSPSNILQLGDVVEAAIKEIDHPRRRISLSIRDTQPNPWKEIAEKYSVGDVIEGAVRNITDFGIFVGIEDGIDGLVHSTDISWSTRSKKKLSEMFEQDQMVKTKLISIDPEKGRLSLGIKQFSEDPWKDIDKELHVGDEVHGKVVHVADFGLFVELREGLEGLVHFSEIGRDVTKKQLQDNFPIDSEIVVKVLKLDVAERRLSLSTESVIQPEAAEKSTVKAQDSAAVEKTTEQDENVEQPKPATDNLAPAENKAKAEPSTEEPKASTLKPAKPASEKAAASDDKPAKDQPQAKTDPDKAD